MALNQIVGENPNSCAYRSDGLFAINRSYWLNGDAKCSNGDTVGFGIILASGQIFCSKNGQRLGCQKISKNISIKIFVCIKT